MTTTKRSIIHSDRLGLTNTRLLNKEDQVDYTRVEGPSLKITSQFLSPEGKRLFLRLFVMAQLQFNFIGGVARAVMDVAVIDPLVEVIKARVDELHAKLNAAIDGAELLFKQHGIANAASYDTPPLEVEVPILCALGRRYYEALVKFDQLMPLLQTLQIHEVVADADAAESCAHLKGEFRKIAGVSRRMADRLRTRLFKEAIDRHASTVDAASSQAANDRETISDRRKGGSSGPPTKSSSTPLSASDSEKSATAMAPPKKSESSEVGKVHLSANARKRLRRRTKRQAEEAARKAAEHLAASQPAGELVGDTPVIPVVGADTHDDTHNETQPSPEAAAQPAISGTARGNGVTPQPRPTETMDANGKDRQADGRHSSGIAVQTGTHASNDKTGGLQPDEPDRGPETASGQHHRHEFIGVNAGTDAVSEQPLKQANGAVVGLGSSSQFEHVADEVDRPTVDGATSIAATSRQ